MTATLVSPLRRPIVTVSGVADFWCWADPAPGGSASARLREEADDHDSTDPRSTELTEPVRQFTALERSRAGNLCGSTKVATGFDRRAPMDRDGSGRVAREPSFTAM